MCLAFFAIFALCSSANAAGYASSGDYLAEAVLNGSNQMPPVTTGANGTFR